MIIILNLYILISLYSYQFERLTYSGISEIVHQAVRKGQLNPLPHGSLMGSLGEPPLGGSRKKMAKNIIPRVKTKRNE